MPVTPLDAADDAVHPARALAALRALAAALVPEEVRDHAGRAYHAGGGVHHDYAPGAERGLALAQELVGHRNVDVAGR